MAKAKPPTATTNALATIDEKDIDTLVTAADRALAVATIDNPIKQMLARADAVFGLAEALRAPGILDSIMKLQGTKLGFRTDQDRNGGYAVDIVADAVIEALFAGVMPTGNEFNIIGGNFYATREGFEGLIRRRGPIIGLTDVKVKPGIPSMQKNGAVIKVALDWKLNGEKNSDVLEFEIRVNAGMGSDAIVGKAKRKAMAWLWNTVTGSAMADADVDDTKSDMTKGSRANAIPTSPLEEMDNEPQAATAEPVDEIPMDFSGSKATEAAADAEEVIIEGELEDEAEEPASRIDEMLTAFADQNVTRKQVEHLLVVMKKPMLEEGQTLEDLDEEQQVFILDNIERLVEAVEAIAAK